MVHIKNNNNKREKKEKTGSNGNVSGTKYNLMTLSCRKTCMET